MSVQRAMLERCKGSARTGLNRLGRQLCLVAGLVLGLRRSARTGMPSRDVLDRATRRAREQDSKDD